MNVILEGIEIQCTVRSLVLLLAMHVEILLKILKQLGIIVWRSTEWIIISTPIPDSIHCLKLSDDELKQFMKIDDFALNHYKKESEFIQAKFIRQKCYIEIDKEGNVNSTIAGMPKHLGKYVNLDNFESGFSIKADDPDYEDKKLTYKHVKGGVILVPTDFTIKE